MKVAVLCNGPSRSLFVDSSEYDYRFGCNIPWTKVDSTVIIDVGVLDKWNTPCNFYASTSAWREFRKRERFKDYLIELFDPLPEYDTSGHAAARRALIMGAKQIDIYGCDSWFSPNTESYTHKWVDGRAIDMSKQISVWRARWYELMAKYPDVIFNFIGEPK
jgi:hypothetical protein